MPHRRRSCVLCLGLIASLLVALIYQKGLISSLEFKIYDFYISQRRPPAVHSDLALILIDDRSLEALGHWPWSREIHARMVDFLSKTCGARAIVLDTLFPEPNPADPEGDAAFARAIREAGNVFLATYLSRDLTTAPKTEYLEAGRYANKRRWPGEAYKGGSTPFPGLLTAARSIGPVNIAPELDGVVRRIPLVLDYRGKPYLTLVGEVANFVFNPEEATPEVRLGEYLQLGSKRIPVDEAGEILINFTRPETSKIPLSRPAEGIDSSSALGYVAFPGPTYRYHEVLNPGFRPSCLARRIVLIGFSATGLTDLHPTPLQVGSPGVDINIQALNGILQETFLLKASPGVNIALIFLFGLIAAYLLSPMRPLRSLGAVILLVGGLVGLSYYLFRIHGLWVATAAPVFSVLASYLLVMAEAYRAEQRESLKSEVSIGTLAQASRIIASSASRAALLEAVREQISQVIGADKTDILLVDETGERLVLATPTKAKKEKPFSLALGEGMAGWIAQTGTAVPLNREALSAEVREEARAIAGINVQAVVYAPLCRKSKPIGVIQVCSSKKGEIFGFRHLELLQALANAVVVALENVDLYEQLEGKVQVANKELVRAYADLALERDRIAALLENMTDGVIMTDPNQRILFFNTAAERFLTLSATETTGKKASEWIPYPELLRLFSGPRAEAGLLSAQLTIAEPIRRVLSAHSVPITNPHGEWVGNVTVLSDITPLHELSEMKSEFISLVSHELRTPLQSILGFTELLQGEGWEKTRAMERQEFLGIILQECHRLLVMINDLLDISRMEVGRPLTLHKSEVDIDALVRKVVLFQSYTTDRHKLLVELPPVLPKIEAEPDKLEQILTNLLSNAIKYSPRGGEVVVSGGVQRDKLVLGVSDQGVGMDEKQVASLFQRFQRLDREAIKGIRGTGLGLYLVKALVELHGGQVGVESQPGRGSRFYFSLPIKQVEPRPAGGPTASRE